MVKMSAPHQIFDTGLLARRLDRVAQHAGKADFLLHHTARDLDERLSIIKREFPRAASLGAWHGVLGRVLKANPSIGSLIEIERSASLLSHCSGARLQADLEALPLAERSLDLAVSGLALHLVNDLPGALLQIRHALKPDGALLASVLGGDTLKELREAWLIAETEVRGGASPRVAPFADVRDFGSLLQRAGFALPVVDSDRLTVTYPSPLALMAELKAMGCSNMLVERSRTPVTRALLARAAHVYAERFGQEDGRVPATFEIITWIAWCPHDSQPKPLRPGSASTRLANALGTKEHKLGR